MEAALDTDAAVVLGKRAARFYHTLGLYYESAYGVERPSIECSRATEPNIVRRQADPAQLGHRSDPSRMGGPSTQVVVHH